MMRRLFVAGVVAVCVSAVTFAQSASRGRWADPGDPTARTLIDLERQWAESVCNRKPVTQTLLADDFFGTAPDGSRYTKADLIERIRTSKEVVRDCRLVGARVRWFGDAVALVYGSETSVEERNGAAAPQCLVWTDTWLKRDGKWQIVAAQDTAKDGDCR